MLRVRNTSCTRPGPLYMWNTGPSLVDDARRVLPAVLQEQQPVVEQLVDGRMRNDADDAAHGTVTPFVRGAAGGQCASGSNQAVRPTPAATTAQATGRPTSNGGATAEFCHQSRRGSVVSPREQHECHHQHHAARDTEHGTQETVDEAQPGLADHARSGHAISAPSNDGGDRMSTNAIEVADDRVAPNRATTRPPSARTRPPRQSRRSTRATHSTRASRRGRRARSIDRSTTSITGGSSKTVIARRALLRRGDDAGVDRRPSACRATGRPPRAWIRPHPHAIERPAGRGEGLGVRGVTQLLQLVRQRIRAVVVAERGELHRRIRCRGSGGAAGRVKRRRRAGDAPRRARLGRGGRRLGGISVAARFGSVAASALPASAGGGVRPAGSGRGSLFGASNFGASAIASPFVASFLARSVFGASESLFGGAAVSTGGFRLLVRARLGGPRLQFGGAAFGASALPSRSGD